jgi:hypothetical protein
MRKIGSQNLGADMMTSSGTYSGYGREDMSGAYPGYGQERHNGMMTLSGTTELRKSLQECSQVEAKHTLFHPMPCNAVFVCGKSRFGKEQRAKAEKKRKETLSNACLPMG